MKTWTRLVVQEEMNSGGGEKRARQAQVSSMGRRLLGSYYAVVIAVPGPLNILRKSQIRGSPGAQIIWETGQGRQPGVQTTGFLDVAFWGQHPPPLTSLTTLPCPLWELPQGT